jgi:hypothetical protein
MKGDIENFQSGWSGIRIGIKNSEIDDLIASIETLRTTDSHFHLRSDFNGDSGIGDIEIYHMEDNESDNLVIDSSKATYPTNKKE